MKKMVIVFISAVMVFVGCDTGSVDTADVISDCSFTLESVGTDSVTAVTRGVASDNGIKIAFRSSDIEFWSTSGDYSNLVSAKYGIEGNVSREVTLSDTSNNVIFMPNSAKFTDYEMPEFEKKRYDIARLDIGSGRIEYSKNVSDLTDGDIFLEDDLDGNSIILIDENKLNHIVYVPRSADDDYFESKISNNDDEDFVSALKLVYDFRANNPDIDMDGALFVPFQAVDFTKNAKKLKISVNWDMSSIFEIYNEEMGEYVLNGDADGTPYDFDIDVEVK